MSWKLCAGMLAAALVPAGARLEAQVEEGKAAKHFELDEAAGVRPDYPALTIEDLRKLTLYSGLSIQGTRVTIADSKYMRKIEPHPREKDILVVTSDHFRFTALKTGVIDPKDLPGAARPSFLWIKHATRESPDGKPWLKDLLLIPYNKKSGKLAAPLPLGDPKEKDSVPMRIGEQLSLRAGDPRPLAAKLPSERESVVGTFQSGKADYVVVDVFGGYSWWGKVAELEYLPLRGAAKADIDEFHKPARGRGWVAGQWRNPRSKHQHEILAVEAPGLARLQGKLPAVLAVPVRSEKQEGWEDLLLLDEENVPIQAIDDLLKGVKTFGDLIAWVSTYAENRWDSGFFYKEWFGPLEEDLQANDRSHIVHARVLRHAFRRMGFPARLHGVHEKNPLYPQLLLEVFLPSQKVTWFFISSFRKHVICEPGGAALYALPSMSFTFQGKAPLFDIHIGGGKFRGQPGKSSY